jgi:hypothetical protein
MCTYAKALVLKNVESEQQDHERLVLTSLSEILRTPRNDLYLMRH